jgi:hypothetical protein
LSRAETDIYKLLEKGEADGMKREDAISDPTTKIREHQKIE